MAGEGLAIARVVRAFPGTVLLKWVSDEGWSRNADGLAVCTTCGEGTAQLNPDGRPDHHRHYLS